MSGPPRVRLNGQTESNRPVLGPGGNNKARSAVELRKPVSNKFKGTVNKQTSEEVDDEKGLPVVSDDSSPSPRKYGANAVSIMQKQEPRSFLLRSNLSMNASCSSDASTDSTHSRASRASTGRVLRRSFSTTGVRRKSQCEPKTGKVEKIEADVVAGLNSVDDSLAKKRCSWVTSNTDLLYAAFHDEEWGVPVHEDKRLFELISLCTALAELNWPTILSRRETFREIFRDFDPVAVSKLNEKKIIAPGNPASTLLSELKLRAIIENARQTCKIIEEHGSFDKYIWSFVNYKPIVGHFRYVRQVPIRTSKADAISKDLIRRGFRGIGPTVVYSFMQVAGLTNDHIINCFRFHDCIAAVTVAAAAAAAADVTKDKVDGLMITNNIDEGRQFHDGTDLELERTIDELSLST